MSSLIIDLQKDALDESISTTNLLRKALVVARKLKQKDFEVWIGCELNGYSDTDIEIPSYRNISGKLKAFNPHNGWIPAVIPNSDLENVITQRQVFDSISELEFLLNSTEGNELISGFSGHCEQQLRKIFNFHSIFQLFTSKSQFRKILDGVRNTVLNWSLKLEEDGIYGEQMIFTNKEKEIASNASYTVNNFYGDVNNSQIQQNSQDSKQER
jgi:hypothetical protein